MKQTHVDIANYLQEKSQQVEQQLEKLIPESNTAYQQLFKAARYSLMSGGKRLRPILALATAETFNCNIENALSPACSLEMVHTYSLIHDDLPCMDNDDFRRGKPTLHKTFPEGHAVLTGDFLLTYAFETLANSPNLTPSQKLDLIRLLAESSGSQGMIGGQVMDLEAEGKNIDLETLSQIHRHKTGALITASILFGGIIANIPLPQLNTLRSFGEKIGLAFQIIDDVLDITHSQQKHGKNISSDITNQKSTYVSLIGIPASQNLALSLSQSALQNLQSLPINPSLLSQLTSFILHRHS
jgi:geranylgeranyl diphosphate synthase type II